MKVFQVSILATLLATVIAEELTKETQDVTTNSATQKLVLKKSEPYDRSSDESTFYSKLKNWIFPGDNVTPVPDSKAVAGHHPFPLYASPPRPIYSSRPDCDPCNKEPWIPIATTYGQNTLIGFVPQSAVQTLNGGPYQEYGVPSPPQQNYGVPPQSFNPPKPVAQNLLLIPPAPVQNFVQPVPQHSYGFPLQLSPPSQLGPSPPLGPSPQLGPLSHLGPPPQLGPPPHYGPPHQLGPSSHLGPPPQLGPSPQLIPSHLGPALNQNYGPPAHLSPPPHLIPPSQLGPPVYGPPKPLPSKGYLPPRPNNFLGQPPNIHRPPKFQPQYVPPRFVQKPKPNNFGGSFNIPFGMKPPLPSSYVTNYGAPSTSQIPALTYGAPGPTYGPPLEGQTLPHAEPSDSYGAPVTGSNVQFALGVQSDKKYLPPPPSSNIAAPTPLINLEEFDDILQVPEEPRLPLPLPNLNQYPMAPLRAPQNFLADFHVVGQESRHTEVVNNNHIPNNQALNHHSLNNLADSNIKPKPYIQKYQQDNIASNHNSASISDVQIVPSIPLASYTSSVEYPINLIQSPLVEVSASPIEENKEVVHNKGYEPPLKLSQNPIVVESNFDNYASSSNHNISYANFKEVDDKDVQSSFSNEVTEILPHPSDINQLATTKPTIYEQSSTLPSVDYSNWSSVSVNFISSSMVPPTPGPSTWLTSSGVGREIYMTTPKPKQIQIIIPYTKGRKVAPYSKEYNSKLSLYTLPPTTESEWLKYSDAPTMKPEVINIKDFLRNEENTHQQNFLPYDLLNFQKNIDDWTALEYSKGAVHESKKLTTHHQNQTSKEIPKNFFITKTYDAPTTPKFFDHEAAGSNQKENTVTSFNNFETNFIIEETTLPVTTTEEITTTTEVPETTNVITTEEIKTAWNGASLQKEKIYVVTPEPLVRTSTHSTIAFSHPPKIGGKTAKQVKDDYNADLKLILSEWPHLINNLETTTNKSTSPHPLFGLMGISSYIAPKNATIETYSGHSKVLLSNEKKQVITIVTPISVSKKSNEPEIVTDSSKT